MIQLYLGDLNGAKGSLQQALQLLDGVTHDMRGKQDVFALLSEVALARGDAPTAVQHLKARQPICRTFYLELQATQKLQGNPDALPVNLKALCARDALVAAAQGVYERAVTLISIYQALKARRGSPLVRPLQGCLDETLAAIRAHVSPSAFEIAWQTGQTLSLSEAFEFLLL